jgi:hypothetical protein
VLITHRYDASGRQKKPSKKDVPSRIAGNAGNWQLDGEHGQASSHHEQGNVRSVQRHDFFPLKQSEAQSLDTARGEWSGNI